ncbi:transposase, type 1 family-containing protein [Caerostris darwini]|uniref:Transposase, type 1 family-containing protein n=1 Tax=Caerostris darwini TaxID=1538125 RepID=A0AAV4TNF0_9ARAC|nr:transposase, type 1 family-containing protein [Caerostris darwini]
MGPPLQTRNNTAVQVVGGSRWFSAKEREVDRICRKGILLIDYLAKGKTITGEYYSNLLDQLDAKICEKRPGLKKKKSHLSPGQRTCAQGCVGNGSGLRDLGYDLLGHPPYSPDLTPSDFHLFSNLKKFVSRNTDFSILSMDFHSKYDILRIHNNLQIKNI